MPSDRNIRWHAPCRMLAFCLVGVWPFAKKESERAEFAACLALETGPGERLGNEGRPLRRCLRMLVADQSHGPWRIRELEPALATGHRAWRPPVRQGREISEPCHVRCGPGLCVRVWPGALDRKPRNPIV